ncbi:Uncharacterized mitochondrial protein AtMg00310 [Linum perenne]
MKKKSIHWCKGSKLCDSRSIGGLGFREFGSFNNALLARQGWRLINQPTACWASILKSLYFPSGNFLSASKGRRPSWIWAGLVDGRSTLKLGCLRIIGNGSDSSLTEDPWIPDLPSFRLNPHSVSSRPVSDLINVDRTWDLDAINSICTSEEANAIARIPIGPVNFKDLWAWSPDLEGRFSVRSAYHSDRNNCAPPPDTNNPDDKGNWKWLWSLSIPPKVAFFMWRGTNNSLATNANLLIRKCSQTSACPFCDQIETVNHCLFFCAHARETWSTIFPSLLPPVTLNFRRWLFSLHERIQASKWALVAAGCWNIWKDRNDFVFNNVRPLASNTVSSCNRDLALWLLADSCPLSTPTIPAPPTLEHTTPPPSEYTHDIYCDGSFFIETRTAAYGIVITDTTAFVCDG